MAYRAMEDALCSLLPTHQGILPSALVQLSSSLVAQSRSKAGNLRVEEEIARTYTCAHIACERLKTSLNLPTIIPRPPCPPKIYSELFKHFTILLAPRKPGRPRKDEAISQLPQKAPTPPPPVSVPIRPLQPIKFAAVQRKTTHGLRPAPEASSLADWIPRSIRRFCSDMEAPLAIPHVMAGVATLLAPSASTSTTMQISQSEKGGRERSLIIAVFFYVFMRLMDMQTTGEEYITQRSSAIRALEGQEPTDISDGKIVVEASDVDAWVKEINDSGWLKESWFENMEAGAGVIGSGEEPVEEDPKAVEVEEIGALQLASGLGTMMQDKVDYLSEAKRQEYRQWKASVLARVTEIEQQSQAAR